jgi:hypothetical protein
MGAEQAGLRRMNFPKKRDVVRREVRCDLKSFAFLTATAWKGTMA